VLFDLVKKPHIEGMEEVLHFGTPSVGGFLYIFVFLVLQTIKNK
jgi:hypothetical protein